MLYVSIACALFRLSENKRLQPAYTKESCAHERSVIESKLHITLQNTLTACTILNTLWHYPGLAPG